MLTLFKDIFWRDQYHQSSNDDTEPKTQRLDRDRYFMGLSLLSTYFFISVYGAQYLYPSYSSEFMDQNYQVFNLFFGLFSPHFSLDPLILALCIMLSARAFGRWLAVPVGLVSFANLSMISLVQHFQDMELAHPDVYMALTVYGVIFLVWLVFQLLMLARPGLKSNQPSHPLVSLNPNIPADKQFTAVQYMWGFTLLGIALVVSSMVISVAVYIFGRYLDTTLLYGAILLIALATLVFSLIIVIKRLRNLGKKPLRWLIALIAVPLLFNALQAYLHGEDFFNLMPLFFVMLFITGFMRFAIQIAQILLLCASYKGKEAQVAPSDNAPNSLMDELNTATPEHP